MKHVLLLFQLLLTGLTIWILWQQVSLIPHLLDLRSQMHRYVDEGILPDWGLVISTSLPYIYGAPVVPLFVMVIAWRESANKRRGFILSIALLLSVALILLFVFNEPLEGIVLCC